MREDPKFPQKPMMADREIEIVDALFEERKPKTCLEWGSGGSTIYFPKKHESITNWLTIEHNGHYCNFINLHADLDKVSCVWVDNNETWYIDAVRTHLERYDFILVDGQFRNTCLGWVNRLLKPDGFGLLHDSGRPEYADGLRKVNNTRELYPGEMPLSSGGYNHRGLMLLES